MEKTDNRYQTYVQILKEELVPAMGCTERVCKIFCVNAKASCSKLIYNPY